jgi:hypothetical protein
VIRRRSYKRLVVLQGVYTTIGERARTTKGKGRRGAIKGRSRKGRWWRRSEEIDATKVQFHAVVRS